MADRMQRQTTEYGDNPQGTILGLDVGGTKTAVVEGTADGRILQRRAVLTEAERPFDGTLPGLAVLMRETIQGAAAGGREVRAISVSIGGPLRIQEGYILDPPHLPGWHGLPLKDRLAAEFPGLPVYVEHDGNAGALAEYHFGVGRGRTDLQHLVFLTFGTGLGAGFIVNGRILHGATDTAGEVGHWRMAPSGPYGYGKEGSWEGFASGQGLVELAALRFPHRWRRDTPIREVVEAMLADDAEALEIAREAGEWMGRGIALLVDALNPQVVVLGSLAVALGERILEPVRQVIRAESLPQAAAACAVVPSVLGAGIGDVAALMAALSDSSPF